MTYAGDLDPQAAYDLLAADPAAVLVDVRTRQEWSEVGVPDLGGLGKQPVLVEWQRHPDGSLNPAFLDELRAGGVHDGAPVVFLCRSGVRSVAAATAATQAGLGPAYNVLEGFEGPVGPTGRRSVAGWKVRSLPWTQP